MASTEITLTKIGNRQYNHVAGRNIDNGFKLIKLRLENLQIPGRWTVKPVDQANWKAQKKFMAMGPMESPMRIRVKCKPGDNGSAWEFDIFPPNINDNSHAGLQKIVDRLNQAEEVGVDDDLADDLRPEYDLTQLKRVPTDDEPAKADEIPTAADSQNGQAAAVSSPVDPEASAAILSRLSTIIQTGRARKGEMKRVADQLKEAYTKLQTAQSAVDKLEIQLQGLREAEANDHQLAEATQLLALAKDIKI